MNAPAPAHAPAQREAQPSSSFLYSNMERICQLARNLASEERALWDLHYLKGLPQRDCCEQLGLTQVQFEQRRINVIRNLRSGLGSPAVAEDTAT